MRRKLLLILGCLLIIGLSAAAADFPLTVSGISIDGNVKIKTSDIVKVIAFHAGDEITADQMKAASQAVYDLGWFSDVIPEIDDTGIVTFKLTENPVVKKIEITGNVNPEPFNILGFTLFSTRIMTSDKARSILRDKGVKTGKVLNNNSLKDGLQAVIDAYDKKGYALIMIGKVTPGETLGIQIIEGRVTANVITGLSTVPEKIAEDMINLPLDECLKKAAIQQVMANLQESVYFSNVDVKVQQGGTPDSVRLLWTLTERNLIDAPITISGIDLSGVTLFPQQIAEGKLADIPQGEIDNYELLQVLQGLFDLYYRNGYVMVRFAPGRVMNGRLPLIVEEGKIGKIDISGNDHTKTYVIEKVFGIKPGDMLNKNRLAVSYQGLMALKYFNSVNVNPAWVDDHVELSVSVVENAKLGGINGSVAFSPESGGLVGKLDYSQKNLFGTGQDLSFSYSRGLINDQSATWDVGYSTVAFFRDFNRVGVDFYRKSDEKSDSEGNSTTFLSLGGTASISYPVMDYTNLTLAYKHETVSASDDPAWHPIDSITTGLSYDDVNNPHFPTSGNRRSIMLEKAGGFAPGPDYTKFNLSWVHFAPLYSNLPFISERDQVLAVRLAGGWGMNIPYSQAYDLGGPGTIRGTSATQVRRLAYANFEYRLAVVEGLTGTLFFDTGVSLDDVNLSTAKGSFGIEFGIEAAGMYVRLDMAWVLGPDMGWVPHFDFGFSPMF
ncbi:MAG: POTRA domain-containing protein [Candidatus Bipolaricaulota bacterium]|nr:POTRA domain-containing protein [Candidatus Bipolaricaulota bacterium]